MANIDADLRLKLSLDEFVKGIASLVDKAPQQAKTDQEEFYTKAADVYNKWVESGLEFWSTSFNKNYNQFRNEFSQFRLRNNHGNIDLNRKVAELNDKLRNALDYLTCNTELIRWCSALWIKDEDLIKERANLGTEDKLNFIVNVLYSLYKTDGERYYPLVELLVWNGFPIRRLTEPQDFAQILEENDLVEQYPYGNEIAIRISPKGILEIERSQKQQRNNKPDKERKQANNKNVFIVHGHDKVTRLELEKILEKEFQLNPIILQEQPIESLNTIVGKLDHHARLCGVAIILMTPDDNFGEERRARENVVLELGYFMGLFEPDNRKILILRKGDAHVPSDIAGVERIDFRESIEEIHLKLKKQFQHWGLIQ